VETLASRIADCGLRIAELQPAALNPPPSASSIQKSSIINLFSSASLKTENQQLSSPYSRLLTRDFSPFFSLKTAH
jgi:hypothetical protein